MGIYSSPNFNMAQINIDRLEPLPEKQKTEFPGAIKITPDRLEPLGQKEKPQEDEENFLGKPDPFLFIAKEVSKTIDNLSTKEGIAATYRPFLEYGGMATGAVAGAVGGTVLGGPGVGTTVGGVAGAGLLGAGGRQLANILDEIIGLRETPPLEQQLKESAKSVGEFAAYEAGGHGLAKGASFVYKKLPTITGAVIAGSGGAGVGAYMDDENRWRGAAIGATIGLPIGGIIGAKGNLTTAQAKAAAYSRFVKESMGTAQTQEQIAKNIVAAREIEKKIPGLKFSQGQLTNDASAVALERGLARRSGQDLSQQQREVATRALNEYYASTVSGQGNPENYVNAIASNRVRLQAATSQADDAVASEVSRLSRSMDEQTVGRTVFSRLSEFKRKAFLKAKGLYDKIPNVKLESKDLNDSINEIVKKEDGIIEQRAGQMISLLRGKIEKTQKVASGILDKSGKPVPAKAGETKPVGYQVLRKIRSRIGKNIRSAESGVNPNAEDARQLRLIKEQVEATMDTVKNTNKQIAARYEEAQTFYSETYIPKYRLGTVADVLQRGPRGESSNIAMANIAREFNTVDGIDDFIFAVGDDQIARTAMHDFYAFDLLNSARNVQTGELNIKSVYTWLAKNGSKLKKLGLYDEFVKVRNLREISDKASKYLDVFNKSVAGRVLESNVDNFVRNSFAGSKNFAATANEMLALARGNRAAEQGLKKAMAEELTRQSETTSVPFFEAIAGETIGDQVYNQTVARFTSTLKHYSSAVKVIYKDEPEKLKSILRIHDSMQVLSRTSRSPNVGGSDTAENLFAGIKMTFAGVAPRFFYLFNALNNMIGHFGKKNVEKYLTRAMFDPDYAASLNVGEKGFSKAKEERMARLMALMLYSSMEESTKEPQ